MALKASASWQDSNQRYLSLQLMMMRDALQRELSKLRGEPEPPESGGTMKQELDSVVSTMSTQPALIKLASTFGLSSFERGILLLCAGVELDGSFARLCAAVQGDSARVHPTFSLALSALPDPHWSAITRAAPLRYWNLIEVGSGETLATSPLLIDERILHYLNGLSYLDERLHGLMTPIVPPSELSESQEAISRRIVEIWSSKQAGFSPVIQLCGDQEAGTSEIAASACAALELQLHLARGADIPDSIAEREALSRLWEREAALTGALLVDCEDEPNHLRSVVSFVDGVHGLVLVAARDPLRLKQRLGVRLDVKKPPAREQKMLWAKLLGEYANYWNDEIERVVGQFNLSVRQINTASTDVLGRRLQTKEAAAALWDACRAQSRPQLEGLAQRIEPSATWAELILPESQLETLHTIALHNRQRSKVYETWGFASKGTRSLGISVLFAGPSGTGKTMAAEVLANDLQLDLYRIDLSQVVSKYIGQTERNLRRVFDAAESGGAILLFDEADALFGKRTEVKDSHDRYANIEISYLLQRMEAYRGLAILTTNMKEAIDKAFLRRIRFIIQFPFPDAEMRGEIWRHIFPGNTPTKGLDIQKLSRLNLTGGNIRNIALNAAFLAAESNEPVQMTHLLSAVRSEYAKLEKPLTAAELGGWA